MGKVHIKFSAPSLTDHLIITWAKFSSPLAEIDRESYAPPHPERSLTVPDLENEMHQFKFWQSNDGIDLDTALLTMDVDAGTVDGGGASMVMYDYVTDRGNTGDGWADPEDGDTVLVDERLIGATSIIFTLRGVGPLRPDEFTFDSVTGTITLTNGDTFAEGSTWFAAIVTTGSGVGTPPGNVQTSAVAGWSVLPVSSDFTFGTTHHNMLLWWEGTALIGNITFPDFATIPNKRVKIVTHGGTSRYLKLTFASGNTINFQRRNRSALWLGAGEEIEIEFFNGTAYVTGYQGEYAQVGMLTWGRKSELNRLSLDGTRYTQADLGRLYADYISYLPLTQFVSEAVWPTSMVASIAGENKVVYHKKGFFTSESGQIRLPDYSNRFIRAIKTGSDTERVDNVPGGYQYDMVIYHGHTVPLLAGSDSGGGAVTSGGASGNDGDEPTSKVGGVENRPENIGLIPQIII